MPNAKVLVIDDDANIRELIRLYLEREGYEVETHDTGKDAIQAIERAKPNLIVLDIMLPGKDGWQICRQLRGSSDTPVLILSAKDETLDKILGLELGADDYMVKPFDPKELVVRVRAILRRIEGKEGPMELRYDRLTVNKTDYTVTVDGALLEMPPRELELLYFLASNPNKVFTRDQLLNQVWGYDYYGDSRTVDVHVKRIREKLVCEGVQWQIKTVWSIGYKFEVK
ncbi:MAG: response regulator transcription factor [Oscillospiraceae bacterium]|nr:response regulator transcription factor [Oscillospiraceae bacterium]